MMESNAFRRYSGNIQYLSFPFATLVTPVFFLSLKQYARDAPYGKYMANITFIKMPHVSP